MKFDYGFIRSNVSRRVVLLFFLSALVPIAAIAFFSFTYVTDLFVEQSYKQLQHASKLYGMSVLDRLRMVDDKLLKQSGRPDSMENARHISSAPPPVAKNHVLGKHGYENEIDSLTIEIVPAGKLHLDSKEPYDKSKTILYSMINPAGETKVYLRRIVAVKKNNTIVTLVAELNNEFLWGNKDRLPFSTALCVIEESGKVLFCPQQDYGPLLAKLNIDSGHAESRKLQWTNANGENLAIAWDLFTKSIFSGPNWRIISSRQAADALMPARAFQRFFPGIILFSTLVVLLLSMIQVRRSMQPLKQLVSATKRLANYEFGEPVDVQSEDEFKELADSFNLMATRLEQQFNELKMLSEIDHLILTYPDMDAVLARIFATADNIIACDFIAITLIDKINAEIGWTYIKEIGGNKPHHMEKTLIPPIEAEKLVAQAEVRLVDLKTQQWRVLDPIIKHDVLTAQVYPILLEGKLRAIFSLGYRATAAADIDEPGYVNGIIDRLAVALATTDRDEKLYHQAHFDHLTGLPNRQLFNDRLEQYLIQAHRKNERIALLYIDLDRFKNINDSLGHAGGDTLLRQVAERIMKCIRETDTISRLGGDEFVIILSDISSPKDAGNIAEHIFTAIIKPFSIHSREIFVNACIGVAIYPEDGKDSKELLAHADAAMYHAKESGRGRYKFFEESMNKEIVQRIEMETAMRHALAREEFTLHYQPQIDLRNGKITAVEALIRWNHPESGLVPPDRFIPLAEECGLIEPLGQWVLNMACIQYMQWRKMNIAPARLAVNISSRQFMQAHFIDVIKNTLANTGMPPRELEFEITESLLMDERIDTKSILNELVTMGVQIAIDDFGTGYSSLSYLRRFPVHTLKIDRSFTRDIPADAQATTLTLSIIAMAHALNIQVVAEGIETKAQLELLRTHQCDIVQGYYFSKPLPVQDLIVFLSQHATSALIG